MPGVLGLAGTAAKGAYGYAKGVATSSAVKAGFGRVKGAAQVYRQTAFHARGMNSMRDMYGLGKQMGWAGRALGFGFMGLEAFTGYQQGGVWGAAKGLAKGAAVNYAVGALLGSAAIPLTLGVGVVAGGMMAYKKGADIGRKTYKKSRSLEFGSGVSDQYGTVATMRRRSVMALQESRIGGGMGLGSEAMRSYQPYFR